MGAMRVRAARRDGHADAVHAAWEQIWLADASHRVHRLPGRYVPTSADLAGLTADEASYLCDLQADLILGCPMTLLADRFGPPTRPVEPEVGPIGPVADLSDARTRLRGGT